MRRLLHVLATLSGSLALSIACSSGSSSNPAPGSDSGSSPSGPRLGEDADSSAPASEAGRQDGASADAGLCTSLARPAANVAAVTKPGSLPAAQGGTISLGTYRLKQTNLYAGFQQSISDGHLIRISSGLYEESVASEAMWRTEVHTFSADSASSKISLSGCVCATLNTVAGACVYATSKISYTATATELRLLYSGANGGVERVYGLE